MASLLSQKITKSRNSARLGVHPNNLLKNLANAEACLKNLDLKLTADHLKVAKWNVDEVKKAINLVSHSKKQKGPNG